MTSINFHVASFFASKVFFLQKIQGEILILITLRIVCISGSYTLLLFVIITYEVCFCSTLPNYFIEKNLNYSLIGEFLCCKNTEIIK